MTDTAALKILETPTNTDLYAERKKYSFSQIEGKTPLPQQLKRGEISKEMRVQLWHYTSSVLINKYNGPIRHGLISELLYHDIMLSWHIHGRKEFHDSFSINGTINYLEDLIKNKEYFEIFDFLEFLLRVAKTQNDSDFNYRFKAKSVADIFARCQAAYHIIDEVIIVPKGSEQEIVTLETSFKLTRDHGFSAAYAQLTKACDHLTRGHYADSVREAIHSVVSVMRVLTNKSGFEDALKVLKNRFTIHGQMEEAIRKLYAYTNAKEGIRHELLRESSANLDEADAMFMLGSCAAFISYIITKNAQNA